MKPAPFQYVAAESVEHAIALLAEHGPNAKLIAGGQSLVPMMNFRLAQLDWLIDINRIAALAGVRAEGGTLHIGSMTRYADLEACDEVHRHAPLLSLMLPHVAHAAIRNRGTIGGSICHADPAAEMPVAMLALDAELELQGPRGTRHVAADDFFVGQMTTVLEADEILSAIRIEAARPDESAGFSEFSRRRGDFAIASAAVILRGAADKPHHVRIAVGGLADRAMRARNAETVLTGKPIDTTQLKEAAETAADEVDAGSDLHASEAYRRNLVKTQVKLALTAALERAQMPGAVT